MSAASTAKRQQRAAAVQRRSAVRGRWSSAIADERRARQHHRDQDVGRALEAQAAGGRERAAAIAIAIAAASVPAPDEARERDRDRPPLGRGRLTGSAREDTSAERGPERDGAAGRRRRNGASRGDRRGGEQEQEDEQRGRQVVAQRGLARRHGPAGDLERLARRPSRRSASACAVGIGRGRQPRRRRRRRRPPPPPGRRRLPAAGAALAAGLAQQRAAEDVAAVRVLVEVVRDVVAGVPDLLAV